MFDKLTTLLALVLLMTLPPGVSRADDQAATTETRLREALKNTMLQLRDAQNQVVTLQAAQTQSDKDNADLKAKVDELGNQISSITKQSADDKAASDKTISELKKQATDLTGQVTRLDESLKQWKEAYNQASQLATAKEAARVQLAAENAALQRTVDDREIKNLELFKTGNEILTRYEKFSLGDAIGAKEPFVGIARVKLQTLVQDYQGKLLDERVTHGQPVTTPAPAPSKQATNPSGKNPPQT